MADVTQDLVDAFETLLVAFGETIVLRGKSHQAVVEEVPSSPIPIPGGESESEQFRIQMRRKEFASLPKKGWTAKVRGQKYDVIGPIIDRNGVVVEVMVGDLSAEEG